MVNGTRSVTRPADIQAVSHQLADLWRVQFARQEWQGRLTLLENIDDEIRAATPEAELAAEISRQLTSKLINDLGPSPVKSVEQAYVYLNSADQEQCETARVWLILNGHESAIAVQHGAGSQAAGTEKRTANRYEVNIESIISSAAFSAGAKLVDISASGAKLAFSKSLPKGTRVELDVPFLGRVAACVVWVAASFIGLSFILDQAGPIMS